MGNQSLEERILFEVEKLINELSIAEASGDALEPSELLHEAVTNVLCSAIFGCRSVYYVDLHSVICALCFGFLPFPSVSSVLWWYRNCLIIIIIFIIYKH